MYVCANTFSIPKSKRALIVKRAPIVNSNSGSSPLTYGTLRYMKDIHSVLYLIFVYVFHLFLIHKLILVIYCRLPFMSRIRFLIC